MNQQRNMRSLKFELEFKLETRFAYIPEHYRNDIPNWEHADKLINIFKKNFELDLFSEHCMNYLKKNLAEFTFISQTDHFFEGLNMLISNRLAERIIYGINYYSGRDIVEGSGLTTKQFQYYFTKGTKDFNARLFYPDKSKNKLVKYYEGSTQAARPMIDGFLRGVFTEYISLIYLLNGDFDKANENIETKFTPGNSLEKRDKKGKGNLKKYRMIAQLIAAHEKFFKQSRKITDSELCSMVNLKPTTFSEWKRKKPKTKEIDNLTLLYNWKDDTTDQELVRCKKLLEEFFKDPSSYQWAP